jgi:uncharacterized protein
MMCDPMDGGPLRFAATPSYRPPSAFWEGPYRQIWAAEWIKARRTPSMAWRRTSITLSDGTQTLALAADPAGAPRGIIAAFHGLGSTADGPNLRRFAAEGIRRGWRVLSVGLKGSGGGPCARLYTAADLDAFDATAASGEFRRTAGRRLFAGFSLSGGMLLRWLGLRGAAAAVDGALALCPTAHLPSASAALERPGHFLYDWRFALLYGRRLREVGAEGRRPHDRWRHRTVRRLDDDFAAPWAGATDADAYYDLASAHHASRGIAKPTLIVAAEDDPFVPPAPLVEHFGSLPAVDLRLSRHGAHVAFLVRRNGRLEPSFPELLLAPLDG